MPATGEIVEFEPAMFALLLAPCSALFLPHILDARVPFVFLADHCPNHYLEWYKTAMPLHKDGASFELEVRMTTFDLQIPTGQFLARLPEFAGCGLNLMQLERKLPDTLQPQYLKNESRYKILRQNGFYLGFYLPHAGEYASVISPHREVLERIMSDSVIASGNLP